MKQFAGDIIILHMCTKNHNHMMYGSRDMECDRHNFLSLWTVFCPFTPPSPSLWSQKIKILKKWKKHSRYHHFTNVYHKWQSYDIWFFKYGVQQTKFFVILDHFLPFYPPNNPKNPNFEKLKKNPWRYHHFTYVNQKLWSNDVRFLRYGARQMDGLTIKSDI